MNCSCNYIFLSVRNLNYNHFGADSNFLDLETARWGGGLPREGVVAKKFVSSLKSLSSLGFEERNLGCPENLAGMSRTLGVVQKVCAQKVRAHFSFPNKEISKSQALSHSGFSCWSQ